MRNWDRCALVLATCVVLGSCASDSVLLRYRFEPHQTIRYDWTIRASTQIDSPTEQSQRVLVLRAEVEQTTLRTGSTNTVTTRIVPKAASEDGVSSPLPPPTVIEYQVSTWGQITRLIRTSGLTPESASTLELETVLTDAFPLLPRDPVALKEKWPANLNVKTGTSTLQLSGTGVLKGFKLSDRRRLAHIILIRAGRVHTEQPVGRTKVLLNGNARVEGSSHLDLDKGVLFYNKSSTRTIFDLTVGGGAPGGQLTVNLDSTMQLQ